MQYAYLSVTFRQHDNYTDVYDGKMANCCQKARGNKKNQRINYNKTKQKKKEKENKQTTNQKSKQNNNKTGGWGWRGIKQITTRMLS